MAPPVPRSKFSKAIIQKAREWRDIIAELPLLEEYDNLEEAVRAAKARADAAAGVEAASRTRLEDLSTQEKALQDRVAALRTEVADQEARSATIVADATAAALETTAQTKKAAEDQAASIVAAAGAEAEKIRSKGRADADAYRTSLATEIADLEARVAALKEEQATAAAAHATAAQALDSLRQQLGVGHQ